MLVGTDRVVDAVCAPVLAWNSMMRRCELLSRKSAGVLGEGWEVVGLWADAHRRGAVVEGQKQLVACEGSP